MSSEKTEQPTPKKLRDARKKGQVAKSQDITSALLMICAFVTIAIMYLGSVKRLGEMITFPTYLYDKPFREALLTLLPQLGLIIMQMTLPFIAIAFLGGLLGNILQIGPMLTTEPIKPELKKLNPFSKLKQMFSMKNLIEFLKSAIKILVVGSIIWLVIQDSLAPLMTIPYAGVQGVVQVLYKLMSIMAIGVSLAFVAIAAFDFFFQKFQHIKQLKMTKDEVKREYKEMDGNPEIKSMRRQLHQEMIMSDTTERTKNASVVVTNPVHLAIAIHYDEEANRMPLVLAKGEGLVARRMVQVAEENGIPVMQHIPLAWALHETVDIDRYIPSDLIEPMAEVLAWLKEWKDAHDAPD